MAEPTIAKHLSHVGVRFYRIGGVEMVLVPRLDEAASFTMSAGDGYFLTVLVGEPGSAYPLNLRARASFDPDYLAAKFRLDRRGYGYTPEELSQALETIARDLVAEESFDQ